MVQLEHWEPCLADPYRGIAFFDQVTIEADRITDPRWDRVLPILEEEQVFMCRMMAPQLRARPGALALDIGTGSGVFAIQAAKLGCRVVAIDVSRRALMYARHNATRNKIPVASGVPEAGEIQFLNLHSSEFAKSSSLRFDFVFLSPPYNPTCPGFNPALHASAGLLGQQCFEEQLPHAAALLGPSGVCFGNQMALVNMHGRFAIEPILGKLFPGGRFSYVRVLSNDLLVESFLRGQYASFLKEELRLRPGKSVVEEYIAKNSEGCSFAFICYQLDGNLDGAAERADEAVMIEEEVCSACPPQNWQDRISLHRRIVEHTALEHSFPSPALFLEIDALPDFPSAENTKALNSSPMWSGSVLRYIDSWLWKTELLHPQAGLFDLLLIDTAPWYPTPEGRRGLRQESMVWVCSGSADKDIPSRFLTCYQENTRRLQNTGIGPFLHPHFTGQSAQNEWRGIQFTVLEQESSNKAPIRPCDTMIDDMLRRVAEDPVATGEAPGIIDIPESLLGRECVAYAHSDLQELDVPSEFRNIFQEVRQRVEKLREYLPLGAQMLDEEVYPYDLGLCHHVMHRRLDILRKDVGLACTGPTTLVGIPVSLASPNTQGDAASLPENYRGGIWVYAASRGTWSPEAERYILDLARLLSMLYEAQYSERAARELRRIGRDEATSAIFHQIPKDFGALEKGLKDLRSRAYSEDATLSEVRALIPGTDSMALMIMEADAAVRRPSYKLLPSEFPEILQLHCSWPLVSDLFRRLIIPYISQRVAQDDVNKSLDFEDALYEMLPEEFAIKFPLPQIEKFDAFVIPEGRDAYIWLLLALRSAAYHAYCPMVSGLSCEQGTIKIRYSPKERALSIFNTGLPPAVGEKRMQAGWLRDITVFKRDGQSWKVVEYSKGIFSAWLESEQLWITTLQYVGS